MYNDFFGLKKKPFGVKPDADFLYLSSGHKEALSYLQHNLRIRDGSVIIIGDVGAGKTTLLNAFELQIPFDVPRVVLRSGDISVDDFYARLCDVIGLPSERCVRGNMPDIEKYLSAAGGILIVIDEAHELCDEMLDELNQLSEMARSSIYSVQLMLLGQKEMLARLKRSTLKVLRQSFTARYQLPGLAKDELGGYIQHRMRRAGYSPAKRQVFSHGAIDEIWRHSRGSARVVNLICDNALLAAFTEKSHRVTSRTVKEVAAGLDESYKKFANPGVSLAKIRLTEKHFHLTALLLLILMGVSLGAAAYWGWQLPFELPRKTTQMVEIEIEAPVKSVQAPVELLDIPENEKVDDGSWVKLTSSLPAAVVEHYGRISHEMMQAVANSNPQIDNIELVTEGQSIYLPHLTLDYTERYSVSIASYPVIEEAYKVFVDLGSSGLDVTIYPYRDEAGSSRYRLTVGSFNKRQGAIAASQDLSNRGYLYAKAVKISMQ